MLYSDLDKIVGELQADDLVFSYHIQSRPTARGMLLTLYQQETGFSLAMQLKEKKEEVRITRFTLTEKSDLEQQSLSLYDAAMVEIVLQALDLLFIVADYNDQQEIMFTLPEDEAAHLASFECFFDENLTLQTSPGAYDSFVNKTEALKTKIRCELWQRQWHDYYLRNYMQNRQKGQLFFIDNPVQEPPQISNVIAFPVPRKTIVTERTI